jgi:hypothetical protein
MPAYLFLSTGLKAEGLAGGLLWLRGRETFLLRGRLFTESDGALIAQIRNRCEKILKFARSGDCGQFRFHQILGESGGLLLLGFQGFEKLARLFRQALLLLGDPAFSDGSADGDSW